jgi:hypothetical protein
MAAMFEFIDVSQLPRTYQGRVLLRRVTYRPSKEEAEVLVPPEALEALIAQVEQHVREVFTLISFPRMLEIEVLLRPTDGTTTYLVLNQFLEEDLFHQMQRKLHSLPNLKPIGRTVVLRFDIIIYSDAFDIVFP